MEYTLKKNTVALNEAYARYNEDGGDQRFGMVKKILADGKYEIPDNHFVPLCYGEGAYSFNAGHVYDLNATDPVSLSNGTIAGRRMANQ